MMELWQCELPDRALEGRRQRLPAQCARGCIERIQIAIRAAPKYYHSL